MTDLGKYVDKARAWDTLVSSNKRWADELDELRAENARLRHDAMGYKESYDDLIGKLSDFMPISSLLGAMQSNEAIVSHIRKLLEKSQ